MWSVHSAVRLLTVPPKLSHLKQTKFGAQSGHVVPQFSKHILMINQVESDVL